MAAVLAARAHHEPGSGGTAGDVILVAQVRLVALMLVPYTYFCKVRRADDTWRRSYFDLLEHAKTTPMTFSAALRASTTGL